jgi:hypothetical protein
MGVGRFVALGGPALTQAAFPWLSAEQKRGQSVRPLPLIVALPPKTRPGFDARLEGQLLAGLEARSQVPVDHGRSTLVFGCRAGGVEAFRVALERLRSGECEAIAVGGIDSFFDPDALEWLDRGLRLHSMTTENGFIPGEGAGFVLLVKRGRAGALAHKGQLLSASVAFEPRPYGAEEPCLGQGITTAVHKALAVLGPRSRRLPWALVRRGERAAPRGRVELRDVSGVRVLHPRHRGGSAALEDRGSVARRAWPCCSPWPPRAGRPAARPGSWCSWGPTPKAPRGARCLPVWSAVWRPAHDAPHRARLGAREKRGGSRATCAGRGAVRDPPHPLRDGPHRHRRAAPSRDAVLLRGARQQRARAGPLRGGSPRRWRWRWRPAGCSRAAASAPNPRRSGGPSTGSIWGPLRCGSGAAAVADIQLARRLELGGQLQARELPKERPLSRQPRDPVAARVRAPSARARAVPRRPRPGGSRERAAEAAPGPAVPRRAARVRGVRVAGRAREADGGRGPGAGSRALRRADLLARAAHRGGRDAAPPRPRLPRGHRDPLRSAQTQRHRVVAGSGALRAAPARQPRLLRERGAAPRCPWSRCTSPRRRRPTPGRAFAGRADAGLHRGAGQRSTRRSPR